MDPPLVDDTKEACPIRKTSFDSYILKLCPTVERGKDVPERRRAFISKKDIVLLLLAELQRSAHEQTFLAPRLPLSSTAP
jgi:hypothetical protein